MRKFFLLFFLLITLNTFSQQKKEIYPIAFYNVENLFDTKYDTTSPNQDYSASGKYKWTKDRYQKKLSNLAYVISQLGKDKSPSGIAILGLAEVENRNVIEDLIGTGELANVNYKIVHYDSPDYRGIDVGLIYNPQLYNVTSSKVYPLKIAGNKSVKTRDILVVDGKLAGEPLAVLVNHWASRRGNDSEHLRIRAAEICKHIADSIYKKNPKKAIVIMGDMNDNPKDKSTAVVLRAKRNQEDVKPGGLYNTMWRVHDKGVGSLRNNNKWNLFDQIIISENLLEKGNSRLKYKYPYVFNKKFLIQQSGNYKGYPLRTFSGATFLNGYSDHFPTLIYLTKTK